MKQKKSLKKLSLNKSTISNLESERMESLKAGVDPNPTPLPTCHTCDNCPFSQGDCYNTDYLSVCTILTC